MHLFSFWLIHRGLIIGHLMMWILINQLCGFIYLFFGGSREWLVTSLKTSTSPDGSFSNWGSVTYWSQELNEFPFESGSGHRWADLRATTDICSRCFQNSNGINHHRAIKISENLQILKRRHWMVLRYLLKRKNMYICHFKTHQGTK